MGEGCRETARRATDAAMAVGVADERLRPVPPEVVGVPKHGVAGSTLAARPSPAASPCSRLAGPIHCPHPASMSPTPSGGTGPATQSLLLLVLVSLLHGAALAADAFQAGDGHRWQGLVPAAAHAPGFTRVAAASVGIAFTNALSDERSITNRNLLSGAGVALGDIDGDGWCDVFLCGLDSDNRLFRNLGGWRFTDVTPSGSNAALACTGDDSTGAAHNIHHFTSRSASCHHILDNEDILPGIEVESAPKLHPAVLTLRKERADAECPGHLMGDDYSTQCRRHDRVDTGNTPIRGCQSGQLCTERGGNGWMLQDKRALQIT